MTNCQGKRSGTNHGEYAEMRGGGKGRGQTIKTDNLEKKHVHFTGLNFIKTSVIQQTPSIRKLGKRCELPYYDIKPSLDILNSDIKVEKE